MLSFLLALGLSKEPELMEHAAVGFTEQQRRIGKKLNSRRRGWDWEEETQETWDEWLEEDTQETWPEESSDDSSGKYLDSWDSSSMWSSEQGSSSSDEDEGRGDSGQYLDSWDSSSTWSSEAYSSSSDGGRGVNGPWGNLLDKLVDKIPDLVDKLVDNALAPAPAPKPTRPKKKRPSSSKRSTKKEIKDQFENCDKNGDGEIDKPEFVFCKLDKDGDEKLSPDELKVLDAPGRRRALIERLSNEFDEITKKKE